MSFEIATAAAIGVLVLVVLLLLVRVAIQIRNGNFDRARKTTPGAGHPSIDPIDAYLGAHQGHDHSGGGD